MSETPRSGALIAFLACGLSNVLAADGLGNGDFETIDAWLVRCDQEDGAAPDYSEAAASAGGQGFRVGRTLVGPLRDGCSGGTVTHPRLSCGGGADMPYCTVTFRARFSSTDGERALIDLSAESERASLPAGGEFQTFRYSERVDPGSRPWLCFLVTGERPRGSSRRCRSTRPPASPPRRA